MQYVTYELTEDQYIPAIVYIGNKSTPVWCQQNWDTGKYFEYIRGNGCGHCCTAMAARLHGINIDPHQEFELCRNLWGNPIKSEEKVQDNWISVSGIIKILSHLNIPSSYYGVPENTDTAVQHIMDSLSEGKQVIFASVPSPKYPFPENPFSRHSHYVLCAGFSKDGKIVVANSSKNATAFIQLVDADVIAKALSYSSEPLDMTWGEMKYFSNCTGYVIVG